MIKSLFSVALIAILARSLSAQAVAEPVYRITVTGVVENRDGDPLTGAEVIAGDLRAITNERGQFSIPNVPGGNVYLVVRRIGYQPGTLEFISESTLKSISVTASLVPVAVPLGTIVVEGKRMDLDLYKNGFYRRKDLGNGAFFDQERLTRTVRLSSVLNEVAGVTVNRGRGGSAIPTARAHVSFRGANYCTMNVFLDGTYLPWVSQVGFDDVLAQGDVSAMEVYPRSNMVPITVQGKVPQQRAECGAILLWSKKLPASAENSK